MRTLGGGGAADSTCSTAVFDLVASCSATYAKMQAAEEMRKQEAGSMWVAEVQPATPLRLVLLACLLAWSNCQAYMFMQEQARAEEVSVVADAFGMSFVRVSRGSV